MFAWILILSLVSPNWAIDVAGSMRQTQDSGTVIDTGGAIRNKGTT